MIAAQEYKKLDWWLVFAYIILTMIGWVSIFSSVFDEDHADIFDISQRYGLQFIWIVTAYVIQTMHSKEATLEEIFIQVTGRGLI